MGTKIIIDLFGITDDADEEIELTLDEKDQETLASAIEMAIDDLLLGDHPDSEVSHVLMEALEEVAIDQGLIDEGNEAFENTNFDLDYEVTVESK